jgi:hypothetical protein
MSSSSWSVLRQGYTRPLGFFIGHTCTGKKIYKLNGDSVSEVYDEIYKVGRNPRTMYIIK